MNNKKCLGKRIKELRKKAGYTQEQFSELIDIEASSLSGIESGRHYPSMLTLERIANVLNLKFKTLFEFENYVPIEQMKSTIINNINNISDSEVSIIYKILLALN